MESKGENREMKYKIAICYAREVDGEPIVIPGFEEITMFIHQEYEEEDNIYYKISEVKTGLSMVHYDDHATSKEEAISILKEKLNKVGLKQILETISKANLVEDLPMM